MGIIITMENIFITLALLFILLFLLGFSFFIYIKIQDSIRNSMKDIREQITETLSSNSDNINKTILKLTEQTEKKLFEISTQVEKRLTDGFEKTTTIFTDVIKRLAIIDSAQQKLSELSSSVVTLQDVLIDKKARGAFGEIQLSSLLHDILPTKNFKLQYKLQSGSIVDCMLFLPEPTGNIAIDSKFPLENYRKMIDNKLSKNERLLFIKSFKQNISKHLNDIASKYIVHNETTDGAIMFIPSESIFSEIHANHSDLVDLSHKLHVWMVSPTTMMAILTTARAVLKDAATKKQLSIIQEHLSMLGKDFERFQKRMDNLAKHINQANSDIEDVHRSSKKITNRFIKIEQVKLETASNDTTQ